MNLLLAQQPPRHEHCQGEEATILRLANSAIAIGDDCTPAARRFLDWSLRRQPGAEWRDSYFALAIMILSVRLEDLIQLMVDHYISIVRANQIEVWELFDRHFCASSREWKILIRETLVEVAARNEQVLSFGSYLLLEEDIAQ